MDENKRKWKICTDYFTNCEYIYPTQQKKAKQFLDYLSSNPNVKSITIFGSSITDRCQNNSDLDIYVELFHDKKIINRYFDFAYDLWTNFTVDKKMLDEINKKGLIIYEK